MHVIKTYCTHNKHTVGLLNINTHLKCSDKSGTAQMMSFESTSSGYRV
jgi:hypothetical protein